MANIIGNIFKTITFGESHGKYIGCVIDGCPSGIILDINLIQLALNRRKPGVSCFVTPRKENDKFSIISGLYNNITTGTPICMLVKNSDHISSDYNNLKYCYRPGHADLVYWLKYGIRDHRGGGRASARTTIALVLSGSLAKQIIEKYFNIKIFSYINVLGNFDIPFSDSYKFKENLTYNLDLVNNYGINKSIKKYFNILKYKGNSIGCCIVLIITNLIPGLGEPLYDKLHSKLAYNIMNLNAVKAIDCGLGRFSINNKGSYNNDIIFDKGFITNHSGGILGGLSSGQDIMFKIYIKPTSSVSIMQNTINQFFHTVKLLVKGRHDPCVGIRALPIIEGIAALTILDFLLLFKINKFY